MLAALESRLAAILADGLATRTHTRVIRTAGDAPDAGKGTVLVTVSAFEREPTFERARSSIGEGDARRAPVRRVAVLRLQARVAIAVTPAGGDAASASQARSLALDDAATIVHLVDADEVRAGRAFVPSDPDPGFVVREFALDKATVDRSSAAAELLFSARAEIWPVGSAAEGDKILDVDRVMAPLPLSISADRDAVAPGGSTPVRVRSFAPTRLVRDAPRAAARLAVSVLSDVPPGERGVIPDGVAGPETGLRIIAVGSPDTVFTYQAPAANPGPARLEYIQVHLATADLGRGVLLGSAAVRVTAAG